MIYWEMTQPGTPEHQIFSVCSSCIVVMGAEGHLFATQCADFVIATAGESLSEVQKVAISTAAGSMQIHNATALSQVFNAILYGSWDQLGVRNMPAGATLSPAQRLGFIHGIYAFSAQKIAAVCTDLQNLIQVPYQHPTLPQAD